MTAYTCFESEAGIPVSAKLTGSAGAVLSMAVGVKGEERWDIQNPNPLTRGDRGTPAGSSVPTAH